MIEGEKIDASVVDLLFPLVQKRVDVCVLAFLHAGADHQNLHDPANR